MRKSAIDHMIAIANDEDYLEIITSMYKPIVIKKTNLVYSFMDYCIRFNDYAKKEKYMIQLEAIDAIKVIQPKFKGMSWYNQGKNKAKEGA